MSGTWGAAESKLVCGLVSRLCDGAIERDEFVELEGVLTQNAEARRLYYDLLVLHGELGWAEHNSNSPGWKPCSEGRSDWTKRAAGLPPGATAPVTMQSSLGPTVLRRLIGRINTPLVYSMITAASVLFAGLTLLRILEVSWPAREVAQPAAEKSVAGLARVQAARVTKEHRAEWAPSNRGLRVGSTFAPGEPLELHSGLAELTFTSGASVLLVGPTQFQVETPRRGRLLAGELTANVPAQAAGYVIATPHAEIVDLGTEFGVRVDAEGAEVHVFGGAVRVESEHQSQQFSEGTACFLTAPNAQQAAPQLSMIAYAPDRFVRSLPQASASGSDLYARAVLASRPIAYWRLNDPGLNDIASDSAGGGYDQTLGTQSPLIRAGLGKDVGPRPSGTVGGMPLVGFEADNRAPFLEGADPRGDVDASADNAILRVGYGADAPIPASVVPANNYSVEMWVRPFETPVVGNLMQRAAEGSEDHLRGDTLNLQLHSTRLGFGYDEEPPHADEESTVLALDAWHHVAMVRSGMNVRVYLNGDLELDFNDVPLHDEGAFNAGLWIFGARRDQSGLKLPGNLDEIAIYDRSLTGAEIRTHFKAALGITANGDPGLRKRNTPP